MTEQIVASPNNGQAQGTIIRTANGADATNGATVPNTAYDWKTNSNFNWKNTNFDWKNSNYDWKGSNTVWKNNANSANSPGIRGRDGQIGVNNDGPSTNGK